MPILLIDGVRYEERMPATEDEFEQIVKEHAKDIFGEQSVYLDIKQKLKSKSGIGSIPDGYVIVLGEGHQWHIIEVELSSHPLYEHIVPQVSKFISGIRNPSTQRDIVDALYREIDNDEFLKLRLKKAIGPTETHKFLSDLLSKPPVVTIIIEKHTEQLDEAISALAHPQIKLVEFRTFIREGVGLAAHAHLFEPLHYAISAKGVITQREVKTDFATAELKHQLEITLQNPSFIRFHLFYAPKTSRRFFPGYKIPFKLETDIGEIQTYVTSAPAGTQVGDPDAGAFIQANLAEWYRKHPTIKVGDKVIFEAIEPMKRYHLKIT
jgi:hypothetical protein